MMTKLFDDIRTHIADVIARTEPLGSVLWDRLLKLHPADIADLCSNLELADVKGIFTQLPLELRLEVFAELSMRLKLWCLSFLPEQNRSEILSSLSIDELTDLFDELSDDELKEYLKLLHRKDREAVLSLMQFDPRSAGGLMHANVLTLMSDFTVEKSIQILQRLQPERDLHQRIFVTNQDNELMGHINLEDLVLKTPQTRLGAIMQPNELVINAHEDRAEIAMKMIHYHLTTVPVVDDTNTFLGVIPSDILVEIIGEEAGEDLYRISALSPMKETYFETPFTTLLYQRSSILLILLMVQSLSSFILSAYQATLAGYFMFFITKLTSAGGNASSQTSALAIQGLATGEMDYSTMFRFMRRELTMASAIGAILSVFTCIQMYVSAHDIIPSLIVSISLGLIVVVSMLLGSGMPFILKRFNVDPANAAGPLLATVMDVIGLFIYCIVAHVLMK